MFTEEIKFLKNSVLTTLDMQIIDAYKKEFSMNELNDLNGKKIRKIWFNGANGDESITSSLSTSLTFSTTFHGDRDEHWVIETVCGVETARHNVRYITSIVWL